jgi:hypothetical protein
MHRCCGCVHAALVCTCTSARGTYTLLARAHVHMLGPCACCPHMHMHMCSEHVHVILMCICIGATGTCMLCLFVTHRCQACMHTALVCTYTGKGVTGRCVLFLHACAGVPMGTRILLSHAHSSADTLACARLMPLLALVHTPRLTPSLACGLACTCVQVHAVLWSCLR